MFAWLIFVFCFFVSPFICTFDSGGWRGKCSINVHSTFETSMNSNYMSLYDSIYISIYFFSSLYPHQYAHIYAYCKHRRTDPIHLLVVRNIRVICQFIQRNKRNYCPIIAVMLFFSAMRSSIERRTSNDFIRQNSEFYCQPSEKKQLTYAYTV